MTFLTQLTLHLYFHGLGIISHRNSQIKITVGIVSILLSFLMLPSSSNWYTIYHTKLHRIINIFFLMHTVLYPLHYRFLSFHGLYGFTCACSVAIKQAHPDRPFAPILPFLRYKVSGGEKPFPLCYIIVCISMLQDIPILLLFLSCVLTLLGILSLSYSIMSSTYVMASWVYLRFYQIRADGSRGDMSDNFSFASFFPEPIQWVTSSILIQ